MNRRQALVLVGLAVAVFVLGLLLLRSFSGDGSGAAPGPSPEPAFTSATESDAVTLYFPGPDRRLEPEERQLPLMRSTEERVRRIVQELIAGPLSDGLFGPLPSEIVVGGIYLGEEGVAYIDLLRPEGGSPPAAGSQREMLMVYSLVNSVVANTPGVVRVALLWNGSQPESLAGHLDTGSPIEADPSLIVTAR